MAGLKGKRYCSTNCRFPHKYHDKNCVRCGRAFVATGSNAGDKKCCSSECVALRRSESLRKPLRTCLVCDEQFRFKGGSSGQCCSRRCGYAFQAWQGSLRRQRHDQARADTRIAKAMAREERRRQAPSREDRRRMASLETVHSVCSVCGQVFERPLYRSGKHTLCSSECRRLSQRLQNRKSRHKNGGKNAERARKRGLPTERGVGPIGVCSRDKWKCQMCGVSTPRRLRGTYHDQAPEVDHIIPLSLSGSPGHVWSNVQCACRRCNIAKGNRPCGQLRLM
jgi:hypothetical protein